MNTEAPKRKRVSKKNVSVVNATEEIKQTIDKADIERKIIHGAANDKPIIEQQDVPMTDRKKETEQAIQINNTMHQTIGMLQDSYKKLENTQKKLSRLLFALRIAITISATFIAWNIFRLIQLVCR